MTKPSPASPAKRRLARTNRGSVRRRQCSPRCRGLAQLPQQQLSWLQTRGFRRPPERHRRRHQGRTGRSVSAAQSTSLSRRVRDRRLRLPHPAPSTRPKPTPGIWLRTPPAPPSSRATRRAAPHAPHADHAAPPAHAPEGAHGSPPPSWARASRSSSSASAPAAPAWTITQPMTLGTRRPVATMSCSTASTLIRPSRGSAARIAPTSAKRQRSSLYRPTSRPSARYLSQTLARIRRLGASGQGPSRRLNRPVRHASLLRAQLRPHGVHALPPGDRRRHPDVICTEFEYIYGIPPDRPGQQATAYTADETTIRRIMKRIARTPIPFQTRVFAHVDRELEIAIENSLVDRTYDAGPEPIEQQPAIESEEVISQGPDDRRGDSRLPRPPAQSRPKCRTSTRR